jgi:hypothetical protein
MPLNDDTWFMEDELHAIEPPPFLIDGVIPARSVNMLFGEFNLGKTFLAIDWAACVATGRSWVGKDTKQGDVLYVASEGDPGNLGTRTEAWRQFYDDAPLRILFYTDIVDLEASASELLREAVARGLRPRLIIIDTLAMAINEGENDNDKMNSLVRKLRSLQEYADPETGEIIEVAWLLVHHVGWSDKNRPRGGSGMPAGLDYVVGMKEGPSDTVEVFHYKAKNSAKFTEMMFRQEQVGESLVLRYVPSSEAKKLKLADKDSAAADLATKFDNWVPLQPEDKLFGQADFRKQLGLEGNDHKSTVKRLFDEAVKDGRIEKVNTKWRRT